MASFRRFTISSGVLNTVDRGNLESHSFLNSSAFVDFATRRKVRAFKAVYAGMSVLLDDYVTHLRHTYLDAELDIGVE